MRKLLALAGILVFALPLAACGGEKKPSSADQADRALSGGDSGTPAGLDIVRDKTEAAILGAAIATLAAGTPGSIVPGSPAAVGTNAPGGTTAGTASPSTPGTPVQPPTSAPGNTVVASTATPASPVSPPETSTASPLSSAALQLTSASGNRNQDVEVVLSATGTAGSALRGWIIDIEYVPAFAEASSCTVTGFAVCNAAYRPTLVRFVGTADTTVSEIGRATFKLVGAAGTSSVLRIVSTECIGGSGEALTCNGGEATLRIN